MQGGWWPQIDESMVVVDRLDGLSCHRGSWHLYCQPCRSIGHGISGCRVFFGATSADGQRAMKPSGSTVTKCGGSAVKNDWQWKMPIFYILLRFLGEKSFEFRTLYDFLRFYCQVRPW